MTLKWKALLGQGAGAPPPGPDLTARSMVDLGSSLDNLYFYFQMDETTGNINDESANANICTPIGSGITYEADPVTNEAGGIDGNATGGFRRLNSSGLIVDGIWSVQFAFRRDTQPGDKDITIK